MQWQRPALWRNAQVAGEVNRQMIFTDKVTFERSLAAGLRRARQAIFAVRLTAIACAAALLAAPGAQAHESEQYTLPVGRQFADLGPWFTGIVYGAISGAVEETNAGIARAAEDGQAQRLAELQSSDYIAGKVWEHLFRAIPTNEALDATLLSQSVLAQFPGLVTMYRPTVSIYDDPLLVIDLTKAVRTFFRAGTVDVNGTMFGTDKLIHFINIGRIYHAKYEERIKRGMAEGEATKSAIAATSRNPLLSEDGMLGMLTTGIHSNGDLAADYAGLKFYRNLTAPVRLGPRDMPPMLVRDGPYWRVQAERDSDFFTAFITPHWNEVLNPNKFARYTSGRLRTVVSERCTDALDWYRDEQGRLRQAGDFDRIARELATYYGADYGFERDDKSAVTISGVCFPRASSVPGPVESNAKTVGTGRSLMVAMVTAGAPAPGGRAADPYGRSALWWAARAGRADDVRRLAASGSDINAADLDGETAVHAAVRAASSSALMAVLAAGADPNAAALYGVTPLMLATLTGQAELADALLRAGAKPNARDLFGKTALHDAALRGSGPLTRVLLAHGADAQLADDAGNTPLRLAERSANVRVLAALTAGSKAASTQTVGTLGAQTPLR
jgi:hypothetical protein